MQEMANGTPPATASEIAAVPTISISSDQLG